MVALYLKDLARFIFGSLIAASSLGMSVTRVIGSTTELSEQTTRAWLRLYAADIVTLLLGTALVVRFWYVFFGVEDPFFMTLFVVTSLSHIAQRVVAARRRWERPALFCSERRFDLLAALILGTAPWPITVPLNAASPLWSIWQPLASIEWVRVTAAVLAVGMAGRRLLWTDSAAT